MAHNSSNNKTHCLKELDPLADNWTDEQSLHFRYYSGENSVEQSIALHV